MHVEVPVGQVVDVDGRGSAVEAADVDDMAVLAGGRQALREGLTGDVVEHRVNTLAVGRGEHGLGEVVL